MTDEERLSFENEFRKLKLSAETGAEFYSKGDHLTPSGESQFIDYIEAFNKAAKAKEYKKVKEILGNPSFPDPATLTSAELIMQLERAYHLLHEHSIALDVLHNVPDAEIYRFIVEDLLEYDMAIIDAPGMVTHFIYEEFYPNDEEDLKQYTREFLEMLIKGNFEFMDHLLHKNLVFRDQQLSDKAFISQMMELVADVGLSGSSYEITETDINTDQASVTASLTTSALCIHIKVHFISDLGYWYLSGLDWPES